MVEAGTEVRQENRRARSGRRGRRGRLWLWVALLVLLVAGGAGGWFWWQQRQEAEAAATAYETVSVTPAAYQLTTSGPGTLEASQSVSVSTSVAGTIESLVSVGDTVEAGQTLVQLESDTLEETVREAEIALSQAQTQLESLRSTQTDATGSLTNNIAEAERAVSDAQRTVDSAQSDLTLAQRLQKAGTESASSVQEAQNAYDAAVASLEGAQESLDTLRSSQDLQGQADTQDLRNAELAVEQAQLTLDRAQSDLADATVVAPIAGVVTTISEEESGSGTDTDASTAIQIQAGTTLSAGQTVLTLSNYQTINLNAQIDETEISNIKVGQSAEVTADAVEGQTFSGEVTAVSPSAETQDNIPVFEVTIQIDNPQLTLRPGMTAEAEIAIETIQETLSVPTRAVQTVGEQSLVELVQEGEVIPLPVEVVGSDGLDSVVRLADAPADTPDGAVSAEGDVVAGNAGNADAGPTLPNFETLLRDGQAVTVRVPTATTAVPTGDDGGGFGPPGGGGGFGGPPGGPQ